MGIEGVSTISGDGRDDRHLLSREAVRAATREARGGGGEGAEGRMWVEKVGEVLRGVLFVYVRLGDEVRNHSDAYGRNSGGYAHIPGDPVKSQCDLGVVVNIALK